MKQSKHIIKQLATQSKATGLAAIVFVLLVLSGCHRLPLERYYTGKGTVHIDVDWTSHFGEKPSGMTIILAKDGDSITFTDITNQVDFYDIELEPGTYKLLIFNQSYGEFGSMSFGKRKSFNDIFAMATQQQRATEFWDVNVGYLREPEAIGCAVDTFTVLPEMADGEPRFVYYKDHVPTYFESLRLTEVVEPMTTEMFIRVKIIGMKYMASVIGNISGMANGFLLSQAWRREDSGYHLLDNWTVSPVYYENGDTLNSYGFITTTIRTFGLPHGRELLEQRDSTSNMISLCFTLIDGTQHVFRYPVGKHIRYHNEVAETRAGDADSTATEQKQYFYKTDVTLKLDLLLEAPFFETPDLPNLPYAQPKGTGAFDAEVSDWGDEEQVLVPI